MATWTAPTTRSTGDLISASIWNTDLVSNLSYLKDSPVFDGDVSVGDDLLLTSSGAVINFNGGDVTITHSSNQLAFAGAATAYSFSDGRVLIGTTTARTLTALDSLLQVETAGSTYQQLSLVANRNDTGGASIILGKSRGTAVGGVTVVNDGDNLGFIRFQAADGVDMDSIAAQILAQVDGAPGSNDTPGRLIFSTAADGAASVTERMRITSTGTVQPGANDGGALGTGSLAWSDLFLASGGVINFANGDVTLTHSSNVLTLDGGAYVISDGFSTGTEALAIKCTGSSAVNNTTRINFYTPNSFDGAVVNGARIEGVCENAAARDMSIRFWTNAGSGSISEKVRISSVGTLLVGTTSLAPNTGIFKFQHGTANQNVGAFVHSGASSPYGPSIGFTGASPDDNTSYFLACGDTTTTRCYIWSDGDLANHDGVYGTISDVKLKQDIADAPSQWDDVKALRFRKYRMKTDVAADVNAPYLLGVVAQELAQTSPGLVDEHPDLDANNQPTGTTTKTVKSSILLMKCAVALQEAMARIEALEARLN